MNVQVLQRLFIMVAVGILMTHSNRVLAQNKKQVVANDWQKLGPGGGGAAFIPTFSYQNPGDFFIRCDMTGAYHSKDGGQSYRQMNFDNGASSFAFDPLDSNTVYAGSAVLNRSKDGGKTWMQLFPQKQEIIHEKFTGDHAEYTLQTRAGSLYPAAGGAINAVLADPLTAGTLYFTMGNFFYYSFNAGKIWKRKTLRQSILSLYSDASLQNEVYLFSAEALYVFNKKNQVFSRIPFPAAMSPAFSFTAGVSAHSGQLLIYALHHDVSKAIEGEFGYTQIWTSGDKGRSWTSTIG